jgi:lipopolysaccharide/colanic/teichoic acid biosynthesis glycosyltransferase/GT2 family glycosyltransferase
MGGMMVESEAHSAQREARRQPITVVVPAYNAAETIGPCLGALLAQSLPRSAYEIIVVDDGSSDGTRAIATRSGVRLLSQPNQGPAAARNAGILQARGEIILFTDADCAPTPTWIDEMVKPFVDPEVVGVRGTYLSAQRELVARFVQMEYEDRYDRMRERERIDFIDTYSAGYRRDVLLANGGFDVSFPMASVEDQELSFRLARKGYKMVFAPGAQVYHLHDRSCWEYAARKFNIGYWKALLASWYPERMVSDAHTPQVLKAQIGLMGLAALTALAVPLWRSTAWAAGGSLVLFLLTAVPFLSKAARKDPAVALAGPLLLALRAMALGIGFSLGRARSARGRGDRHAVLKTWQWAVKRLMDVAGSVAGLVLLAPLVPFLAVLIKLDSKGPVFYVQERVGQSGRVFRVCKFRSMVDGADEREEMPWEPRSKTPDDARVTRVGKLLRRTSLDEAPQFWNVLRGEMSLVGPRPEETRVVQLYSDWHRPRLALEPGMTGTMQVHGRADLPLDERVQLELAYIEHYSLREDIKILARTLPALLARRGCQCSPDNGPPMFGEDGPL